LPKHVGYPIGENPHEYFMLEIHLDNPKTLSGVRFETGVEVLYTDKLRYKVNNFEWMEVYFYAMGRKIAAEICFTFTTCRKHDAGMMTIGHTVVASLLIPPKSKNFQIVGHCSSECTNKVIPDSGISIFNVLMHTHLAGKQFNVIIFSITYQDYNFMNTFYFAFSGTEMKLRHFRKGIELPWIANDDSYHFNFQKNRPLQQERKIKPGDHITFECIYDTLSRTGMTVAGYSTTDEMCETFAWYYPKSSLSACSSFYPIEKLYNKFGIQNVTW